MSVALKRSLPQESQLLQDQERAGRRFQESQRSRRAVSTRLVFFLFSPFLYLSTRNFYRLLLPLRSMLDHNDIDHLDDDAFLGLHSLKVL